MTYYSGFRTSEPLSWNCPGLLGSKGPASICRSISGEHAIARLEQRLPLGRALVHKSAIDALELPQGLHRSGDGYLVDVRIGPLQGPAISSPQILPRMVFVKTFLFLTMRGTPRSRSCSARRSASDRPTSKHYRLDEFHTLAGTRISSRTPCSRGFWANAAAGILLSLVDPDVRMSWVDLHGARFKERFGIREAKNGFMKSGRNGCGGATTRPCRLNDQSGGCRTNPTCKLRSARISFVRPGGPHPDPVRPRRGVLPNKAPTSVFRAARVRFVRCPTASPQSPRPAIRTSSPLKPTA